MEKMCTVTSIYKYTALTGDDLTGFIILIYILE